MHLDPAHHGIVTSQSEYDCCGRLKGSPKEGGQDCRGRLGGELHRCLKDTNMEQRQAPRTAYAWKNAKSINVLCAPAASSLMQLRGLSARLPYQADLV
eukprot:366400-Chlamydomonas_euryale.AAC.11